MAMEELERLLTDRTPARTSAWRDVYYFAVVTLILVAAGFTYTALGDNQRLMRQIHRDQIEIRDAIRARVVACPPAKD